MPSSSAGLENRGIRRSPLEPDPFVTVTIIDRGRTMSTTLRRPWQCDTCGAKILVGEAIRVRITPGEHNHVEHEQPCGGALRVPGNA